MPSLVKALNEAVNEVHRLRVEAQRERAIKELKKLKELGVDVKELLKALK